MLGELLFVLQIYAYYNIFMFILKLILLFDILNYNLAKVFRFH